MFSQPLIKGSLLACTHDKERRRQLLGGGWFSLGNGAGVNAAVLLRISLASATTRHTEIGCRRIPPPANQGYGPRSDACLACQRERLFGSVVNWAGNIQPTDPKTFNSLVNGQHNGYLPQPPNPVKPHHNQPSDLSPAPEQRS
jgi:hypothetical protein